MEGGDPLAVLRSLDHAELVCVLGGHADTCNRHTGTGGDVVIEHLARIHPVNVVRAEHHDVVGLLVVHEVQRLVDGVCGTRVPAGAQTLLGRHRRDVVAEQRRHAPRGGDVSVQGVRLVLGQDANTQETCVDQVGQHEVHEAIRTAEGHSRFGPVGRQRHQPLSGPTG